MTPIEVAMLTDLFINIVASIIYDRGKTGLGKYLDEPPWKKAIEKTSNDFPSVTLVRDALTKWCRSDDFAAQVEILQDGRDESAGEESLVDSFIDVGGFYDGINNTHSSARRVLEAFFRHLEEELSRTDLWPIIQERRAKLRQTDVMAGLKDLSKKIQPAEIENAVRRALNQFPPVFNLSSSPIDQDIPHFTDIDFAVDLLKEGRARSASTRLASLRATLAEKNPSADVLFRIAANLGSCALQLDDFETARVEYERALSIKPEHHLVLSYAALVMLDNNDTERALDYARRSRPAGEQDPQIASNYLRVLNSLGLIDEIEHLLLEEDWIEVDPNCAFTLGLIHIGRNEFARAESYYRTAIQGGGENPHAHRLLAQAIVLQVDEVILNNPPLRLSEDTITRIDEAEKHLTSAVHLFENYENQSRLKEALVQRSYVRGLSGNISGSLADCDRILDTEPKYSEALRQKGHTLLAAGRIEDAQGCFKNIEDEDERHAATLAVGLAHHRVHEYDQVIDTLVSDWNPKDRSRQQAILADMLLSAYHHKGASERITALVTELKLAGAEDPEALLVLARQNMREGKKDVALGLYKKALENATPGNQHDRISLELAEYYFETEKWADASEYFKNRVDLSADNPLARRYLLSLYNAGARRDALDLAISLRGGGKAIPFVSEVEAQVLAACDDYQAALTLFEQLAKQEPGRVTHKLWAVEMLRGLKNYEQARAMLELVKLDEIKDDSPNLVRAAMLRQKLHMSGDLQFAYRARRVDFSNKDVHDAYVSLFMNHTSLEHGDLDVDNVAIDCAVRLKDRKGLSKTYLIVEQEVYDPQHNEIPPTDLRSVKLIGLNVGDHVTFNEGRVDEAEFEIAEVQSKYVYAYQQTITSYNHWFGGGGDGMLVMEVGDGDLSGLFQVLDRQAERGEKVSSLYDESRMPLSTLARMRGRNLFEVWASLIGGDMRLFATSGELSEIRSGIDALAAVDDIAVEMSGLLTLNYLGLLDKLPLAFRRIFAARTMIEQLADWVEELERQTPHMTVWKERNQYFRNDVTEEMIAQRHEFLGKINSFVEQQVEIIPTTHVLDVPSKELERYQEVLGESAVAALFVASETVLPLYMDDMGLNQVAADKTWQIQGVPTQIVLLRFKSKGLLSEVEYYAALKKMILSNYVHIWTTSPALWWMCRDEGGKATQAMSLVLKTTLGPDCLIGPALIVGAELIYKAWLEISDKDEKLKLVDLVIDAIESGRDGVDVASALKEILTRVFKYLPSALPDVFERIDQTK